MTARLACLLVVVAVAAGACGSRTRDALPAADSRPSGGAGEQAFAGAERPDDTAGAPASGDDGTAGEPSSTATSSASDDARAGSSGGGGDDDGGADADPPALPSGPPPASTGIVTGVEPLCPARGDVVTMTIETVPFADITYAASFADGRHHNVFGLAQAGPTGEFTLTFAIPADAAEGDGQVIAGAAHPSGGGGEGRGYFRVEGEACG